MEKLILYFYEKDKSISLEEIFAKYPLEESGRWDKEKRNYFIDRGGVKFFFQLDYEDLKNSWGIATPLDAKHQFPLSIDYLIVEKITPSRNPLTPSKINKYIKELHFEKVKKINF